MAWQQISARLCSGFGGFSLDLSLPPNHHPAGREGLLPGSPYLEFLCPLSLPFPGVSDTRKDIPFREDRPLPQRQGPAQDLMDSHIL